MANWPFSEDASKRTLAGDVEVLTAELSKAWRDRDELLAALEAVLFHQAKCLCAADFVCSACEARGLIARIKAGK